MERGLGANRREERVGVDERLGVVELGQATGQPGGALDHRVALGERPLDERHGAGNVAEGGGDAGAPDRLTAQRVSGRPRGLGAGALGWARSGGWAGGRPRARAAPTPSTPMAETRWGSRASSRVARS
jgi:hypothetical protein